MYEKKETAPLLPVASSSPPPYTHFTDIHNYEIEEKTSTTPTTPPTSPVPASPTLPATSTWTRVTSLFKSSPPSWATPATDLRSPEVQACMDEMELYYQEVDRQSNKALIFHIVMAIILIILSYYAAPLLGTIIIFVFKQLMAVIDALINALMAVIDTLMAAIDALIKALMAAIDVLIKALMVVIDTLIAGIEALIAGIDALLSFIP